METFTRGSDLKVIWTLLYINGTPFPLEGHGFSLKYKTSRGEKTVKPEQYSVSGNVLTWNFPGAEQLITGSYSLKISLESEQMTHGEFVFLDAFSLSPVFLEKRANTCCDQFNEPTNVVGDGICEITSRLNLMHSAIELALAAAERVPEIDDHLDPDSKNPVQNWVIYQALMSYYKVTRTGSFTGARGKTGTVKLGVSVSFNDHSIDSTTYFYKQADRDESSRVTSPFTDTIPGSTKTYYTRTFINGRVYEEKTISVSAYYQVLWGFTTFADGSADMSKLMPREAQASARGNYKATNASASTDYFVIAVPMEDVAKPTRFSMGTIGANFSDTEQIYNGITYKVYYIGTYDKGATLDITAE